MQSVVELAEKLWPKASSAELSLVEKIFTDIPESKARSILEDARISSRYASIPLKDIEERASKVTKAVDGTYIECWAVHEVTGKHTSCFVVAQSNEGAKVQFEKYLEKYNYIPIEHTLFIGKETEREMNKYRIQVLRQ